MPKNTLSYVRSGRTLTAPGRSSASTGWRPADWKRSSEDGSKAAPSCRSLRAMAQGGFWSFSERTLGKGLSAICLPLTPPTV